MMLTTLCLQKKKKAEEGYLTYDIVYISLKQSEKQYNDECVLFLDTVIQSCI